MASLEEWMIASPWNDNGDGRICGDIWRPIRLNARNRFEIVKTLDGLSDTQVRLEAFRRDFMALNSRPVLPSQYLRWDHMVELCWVLTVYCSTPPNVREKFQQNTPNYPQFKMTYSSEITGWFEEGILLEGMKAYIKTTRPWYAKLMLDASELEDLIKPRSEERPIKTQQDTSEVTHNHEDDAHLELAILNTLSASGSAQAATTQNEAHSHPTYYPITYPATYPGQRDQPVFNANERFSTPVAAGQSSEHVVRGFPGGSEPKQVNSKALFGQTLPTEQGHAASQSNSTISASEASTNNEKQLILASEAFIPCRSLLGLERVIPEDVAIRAQLVGIPINKYQGEINERLIQNRLLPVWENCSLRVTNLHPDATDKEVFDTIHTGDVYHYHRLAPSDEHYTSAFNLIFMERQSARNYLHECRDGDGIEIRGLKIVATWNRDKCKPNKSGSLSRVVRISGPRNFKPVGDLKAFSIKGLEDFFVGKFFYTLIEAKEWVEPGHTGRKVVQFSFGSILSQGEMCRMLLCRFFRANNLLGHGPRQFSCSYQPDPCGSGRYRY